MAFDPPPLPPIQPRWDQFQIWWQQTITALKAEFGGLAQAIEAMEAAQAAQTAAETAEAAAVAAAADAATAQASAEGASLQAAIANSWTVPTSVATATDAGTDATITIAAHERQYADSTSLAGISGHVFTGLAYDTFYGVYYDDITRTDTTPAYQVTTTVSQAQNNYVPGRHLVATITTPAAAAPPTKGGTAPPGSKLGTDDDIYA